MPELNLTKGFGATAKAFGFHAQLVEHGKVKVGERQLGVVHLTTPARISTNPCGSLMLVVALTVLEVSAVLKSHASTAHQDKRVVAREVEGAGG